METDYGDLYDIDSAFLAKRKAEWQDFLARMNSPKMVANRGGAYLVPGGYSKYFGRCSLFGNPWDKMKERTNV